MNLFRHLRIVVLVGGLLALGGLFLWSRHQRESSGKTMTVDQGMTELLQESGAPADMPLMDLQVSRLRSVVPAEGFSGSGWVAGPPLVPENLAHVRKLLEDDRDREPGYEHFSTLDLIRGGISQGTTLEMVATLQAQEQVSPADGAPSWTMMCLQLGERPWYCLGIRPPTTGSSVMPVGERLRLQGRFLGQADVPCEGGHHAYPVIMIGTANPSQANAGTAPITEDLAQLFKRIDDTAPVLEKNPYYRLLGQVLEDSQSGREVYAGAEDGVLAADAIQADQAAFRGRILTITAQVWDVIPDVEVATDRPYDLTTVYRIRLHRWVHNPRQQVVIEGTPIIRPQDNLHAFEVAVIADGSSERLPVRGEWVTATGRFLKIHGYPRKVDPLRELKHNILSHSLCAYFKMIVASSFRIVPAPTQVTGRPSDWKFIWGAIVACLALIVLTRIVWSTANRAAYAKPGDISLDRMRMEQRLAKIRRGQTVKEGQAQKPRAGSDDQSKS